MLSQQERKGWEEAASTKMSSSRSNYSYKALDTSSHAIQSAVIDQRKQVEDQIEFGSSKKKIRVQSDHNVDEHSFQDCISVETEKPTEDDNSRPKRPMTAYMFFTKDARPIVKAESPNMTGPLVASELGKRWASLCAEEKSKYKKLELEARKEYGEMKKKWKLKNKSKVALNRIAPTKRPSLGSSHNYSIYCASTRTPSNNHNYSVSSYGAHGNVFPTVASTYCSSTTTGSVHGSESFVPTVGEYNTFKSGGVLQYSYPRKKRRGSPNAKHL